MVPIGTFLFNSILISNSKRYVVRGQYQFLHMNNFCLFLPSCRVSCHVDSTADPDLSFFKVNFWVSRYRLSPTGCTYNSHLILEIGMPLISLLKCFVCLISSRGSVSVDLDL